MLNLPSPPAQIPTLGPLDAALPAAPEAFSGVVPAGPEAVVRADFDDVLAASILPPALLLLPPEAAPAAATPNTLTQWAEDAPQDQLTSDAAAIAQPWALVLVPELASLPAELAGAVPSALPLGDAPINIVAEAGAGSDTLGRGGGATGARAPWPPRANGRPGLAVALPPADPARPRGWQVALPAAAAPAALQAITGGPIPYPAADLPPAASEAAGAPPLPVDPAQKLPNRLDLTPVPAISASAAPAVLPARPQSAPAAAGLAPVAVTPVAAPAIPLHDVVDPAQMLPPPVVAGVELVLREPPVPAAPRAGTVRRAASSEPALLAEPPVPAISLQSLPLAAPPTAAAPPATALAAAPDSAPDTAVSIASERLGEIAVRLSGSPDQLQVAMQAQPAAAALIGADASRLSQDLAAAGVALAGLSINGQRADLGGGGRGRQRQSGAKDGWHDADAPVAVRRLAARSALNRTTSIDRFA